MTDESAWVYLLRCRDGSLYCGWTNDLDRRLHAHRSGRGARYTRSRLPVALTAAWTVDDASAARRAEAQVKRLSRAGKLALLARAAGRSGFDLSEDLASRARHTGRSQSGVS